MNADEIKPGQLLLLKTPCPTHHAAPGDLNVPGIKLLVLRVEPPIITGCITYRSLIISAPDHDAQSNLTGPYVHPGEVVAYRDEHFYGLYAIVEFDPMLTYDDLETLNQYLFKVNEQISNDLLEREMIMTALRKDKPEQEQPEERKLTIGEL